jgi:WD40 repeat protein
MTARMVQIMIGRFGVILTFAFLALFALPDGALAQTKPLRRFDIGQPIHTLRFSPDGRMLAATVRSQADQPVGRVRLWLVGNGQLVHDRMKGYDRLAFSPNGAQLAVRDPKGMSVFDVKSGKSLRQFASKKTVCAMAFSADGKRVITALGEGAARGNSISVWNIQTGRTSHQIKYGDFASALTISPDGTDVAVGGWGGTLSVFRWAESKRVAVVTKIKGYKVFDVAFSPDGAWIASAHQSDARLTLWDAKTLRFHRELHGANGHLYALDYSSDGRLIAAAGSQRDVYIWESRQDEHSITKQTAMTLNGHTGRITTLAVSPDGRLLATGDRDGVVHIWSMRERVWTLQELAELSDVGSAAIWKRLGSEDPSVGFAAVQLLAAHPKRAIPLILRNVKAMEAGPPKAVHQLIIDLSDADFTVRERASQHLLDFLGMHRAFLVNAREAAIVPEARHRLQRVLASQDGAMDVNKALHRAIHALEWIRTPEAVALIQHVGRGRSASVRHDALTSLQRLGVRVKKQP